MLHLDRAIRYEDALIYQEPPDWHAPVRQNLGAVLLAAGRADEAEAVFWEDLKKNPENGWSLVRAGAGAEGAGQGRGGRGGRSAIHESVEGRRRQADDGADRKLGVWRRTGAIRWPVGDVLSQHPTSNSQLPRRMPRNIWVKVAATFTPGILGVGSWLLGVVGG